MQGKKMSITDIYKLVVDKQLLSKDVPTTLDELEDKLKYSFLIDHQSVNYFIQYIKDNDCENIEWDFVYEGVRRDRLYAKPRSYAVIIGDYSRLHNNYDIKKY